MVDVDINYRRACCGLLPGGCGDGGGWSWKTGGKQVEDGGEHEIRHRAGGQSPAS